jgi:hypothetical protein
MYSYAIIDTRKKLTLYKSRIWTAISLLLVIVIAIAASNDANLSYATECPNISSSTFDSDGDGITDVIEINGVDINNDGQSEFLLDSSDPCHKDIFLEIDYMENHQPKMQAIQNVENAFANAPVANPDGRTGINLHILVDNSTVIEHQDQIRINCDGYWSSFNQIQKFGTQDERQNSDIVDAKRSVYYYGIFIHTYSSNRGSSGCADYNSRNLVVSLGYDAIWAQEGNPLHRVGSRDQQEGTLMHELGHLLNIWHGGATRPDVYKPNYLSVMNYNFQFSTPVGTRPLDYSKCALPTLNENLLNESEGIGNDCSADSSTWVGWHNLRGETRCRPDTLADTDGTPVDYDGDNNFNETLIQDINCDRQLTELRSQNDWHSITYVNGANGNPNNISSSGLAATGENISETAPLIEKSAQDVEADLIRLALDLNETIYEVPDSSFNVPAAPIVVANLTLDLSNATMGGIGVQSDPVKELKGFLGSIIGDPNNPSAGIGAQETLLSLMATENWDGAANLLSEIDSILVKLPTNGTRGGASVEDEPLLREAQAQQEINRKIVNFQAVLANLED